MNESKTVAIEAASISDRGLSEKRPLNEDSFLADTERRIFAVADAFDALTEERCYHEPWPMERALEELTSRSGTFFDPDVIEAFGER